MKHLMKRLSVGIILFALLTCAFSGCRNDTPGTETETERYCVTFNSVGGLPIESQIVEKGGLVTKPGDPVKEGFTFVEWQFENSVYDFNAPVTQDMTIVALYTMNEGTEVVQVTFNAENGASLETVEVAKGQPISEPPSPTKTGFVFVGWYFEGKRFDFSTAITGDITLIAEWTERQPDGTAPSNGSAPSAPDAEDKPTSGTDVPSEAAQPDETASPSDTPAADHLINFSDIWDTWYAEGYDEITLMFSADSSDQVSMTSIGFNVLTGDLKPNCYFSGKFYEYSNGQIYAVDLQLVGKDKLIYTVNNKTMTFYHQPNYPQAKLLPHEALLDAVDGYYWYLDGYEYTYLHPTVDTAYNAAWESENIYLTESELVAYEKFAKTEYYEYLNKSEQTSYTLDPGVANQVHEVLIETLNMRVSSNKLYISVAGTQYSFTRYSQKKTVTPVLTLRNADPVAEANGMFSLELDLFPWWQDFRFTATSSGNVEVSRCDAYNDVLTVSGFSGNVGTGTVVIQESNTGYTKTITISVKETPVSGVSVDKTSLELYINDTTELTATVSPYNAKEKGVIWTSSDPSIASVSSSGKVTATGYGSATITATTIDGRYTATCDVAVKQLPLTVQASIGMETRISSSSAEQGVIVELTASGGSGSYVAYSIKLYCDGMFIGELSSNEMFVTPFQNGTYTAEVWVKDSDGNEASSTTTTTISVSV